MKVAIRVDASSVFGIGHFMRCLTLADALSDRGVHIRVISRHLSRPLQNKLATKGHEFILLDSSRNNSEMDKLVHSHWLGVSQAQDAADSIQALSDQSWDWLIVDHYALDACWESALRQTTNNILVIDDLADRMHDCNLLLDQNLVPGMDVRYRGRVPDSCGVLLGPEYALLQPVYADLHHHILPREGAVRRIMVSFGGTDHLGMTSKTVSAFLKLSRDDIHLDVVLPSAYPKSADLSRTASGHANIHLHTDLPSLATLVARADLAIGAAGSTSWERCCLGLPAMVITLAENQALIAKGLQRAGAALWLGNADEMNETGIHKALDAVILDEIAADWSIRCHELVDGIGTVRVCAALLVNKNTSLKLRYAKPGDEDMLLQWANNPATRRNAFQSKMISPDEHHCWFCDRLHDVDECKIYIAENEDGVPIGQVRFERQEGRWKISYSLAPHFRGRGLGRRLLETAMHQLRNEQGNCLFFGEVKADNVPSRRVFESLGFAASEMCGGKAFVYQRAFDRN